MAEPYDTWAADLIAGLDAEDQAAVSAVLQALSPSRIAQLQTALTLLGRLDGLFFFDGPPSDEDGAPGSVGIDLTAKVFWGPKTEDGWGEGEPFLEGPPGPAIEMQTTETHIQWRVVGADDWINLIALALLAGADGREVGLQVTETHIQWRLGEGEWSNLIALSALKGADGREVEMDVTATHIRWRLAGGEWVNLLALSALTGSPGWVPVLGTETDGARRVQRVVDWVGGEGAKPATGKYLGPAGWVDTAAEATDVRGPAGSGTGDVIGPGTHGAGRVPLYGGANSNTLTAGRALGVASADDIPDRAAADARYAAKLLQGGAGNTSYRFLEQVARFISAANTPPASVGPIRIELPAGTWAPGVNTLVRFRVEIFRFSSTATTPRSMTLLISGYIYSVTPAWPGAEAVLLGGYGPLPVAFGYDGNKPVIWIGDATTTWAEMAVSIEEAHLSYGGAANAAWAGAWAISLPGSGGYGGGTQLTPTSARRAALFEIDGRVDFPNAGATPAGRVAGSVWWDSVSDRLRLRRGGTDLFLWDSASLNGLPSQAAAEAGISNSGSAWSPLRDRQATVAYVDPLLATKADLVSGKIPVSQIPARALTDVFVAADEAAMLDLDAQTGDFAIREDEEGKVYLLGGTGDPSDIDDWLPVNLGVAPFTGGTLTDPLHLAGFSERAGGYDDGECNIAEGSIFAAGISGATTISLTGLPGSPATGQTVTALLRLTITGSPVITWPSGVVWAGGSPPVIEAGVLIVTLSAWWTGSAWAYAAAGAMYS